VWVALRHLNSSGIYSDMFTSPNHGPGEGMWASTIPQLNVIEHCADGKVDKRLAPVAHIFYTVRSFFV
jgi:hypothetical protein